MFTVYILYSIKYHKIYIGFTSDIEKRILSHNELATKGYTIKYRPWVIVFTEKYETKSDAMRREKQLKGAKGREFIWEIIKNKGLISA
jgi:putative endonuclease